jgi:hypothetical protein
MLGQEHDKSGGSKPRPKEEKPFQPSILKEIENHVLGKIIKAAEEGSTVISTSTTFCEYS